MNLFPAGRLFRRNFLAVLPPALLLVLLLSAAALAAPGQDNSQDTFPLVARALRARLHQTFTGCQVIEFTSGKKDQWIQVVADVAHDGRRSRMDYRFPASVADMLIADDGVHLRQFHPSCRLYLIRRSPPSEEAVSNLMLSLLRHNYRCQERGMGQANGRPCDLVALSPRFESGPSRLYWIDHATQAILRTEEFDSQGRREYLAAYRAIQFAPHLPAALFAPAPPPGMTLQDAPPPPADLTYAQARAAAAVDGRAPCWAPGGYHLLRCASLPRSRGAHALLLRYGDGLKTLRVYEETLTPALPPLAVQQRMLDDEIGRYGQQAWVQDWNNLRVTVVGDVTLPAGLGQGIMRALDPVAEQRLSHALIRDFGPGEQAPAERLRRQGWGYEQIAARLLVRKEKDADRREEAARAWVAASLRAAKP